MPSRRSAARPTARAASTGSSSTRRSTIPTCIRRHLRLPRVDHRRRSPPTSWLPATAICSRSAQMAQPEVLAKFTKEQLDAMQCDTLDERIANAVEFDIVPQYDKLLDIYTAAMRTRSESRSADRDLTSVGGEPQAPRDHPRRCAGSARSSAARPRSTTSRSTFAQGEFFTIVGPSGSGKTHADPHAGRPRDARARATSCCAAGASTTCRPTGARPAWCSSRWRCSIT